jgi:hypothetical protein
MTEGDADPVQAFIRKNLHRVYDACVEELKDDKTSDILHEHVLLPVMKRIYKECYPYIMFVLFVILCIMLLSVVLLLVVVYLVRKLLHIENLIAS